MKYLRLAIGLLLCTYQPLLSQETNAPSFGKGIFNLIGKDSTWSMKIGARIQLLGTATWEDSDGEQEHNTNFLVRRARFKFDGHAFSPRLTYKIEMGLSNRDMSGTSAFTSNTPRYIMDAVVKWNFAGNWELWAGQTKLPGNIERVISSGDLQQVDRSLLNSRYNIDRDIGLQLRNHHLLGKTFLVREKLAISQGEGRNITTGNLGGYEYTARLELLPFGSFTDKGDYKGADLKREPTPKLMLATTYDTNKDAVRVRSNQGSYMENDLGFYETEINTWFVDAMFKYQGLSLMAEYAHRTADDPIAKNGDGSATGTIVGVGDGINIQSGYVMPSNWEISGRYTHISWDAITTQKPETQYTFGLSKYIVGHKLKVQTDLSLLSLDGQHDQTMYRLQLDLHF